MKDILVATYTREDTYHGHSKINHYHIPTEIRCYVCDNSAEREMGILVNGQPCPDYYDIVEYNYKGQATYRHHFTDRDNANKCFMALMKKVGGFKKVETETKTTNRETVIVRGYTYSVIYNPTSKKWSGVREFTIAPKACFRDTKEAVLEWIEKDIEQRLAE